ncbi:unnamed protein product, partial [marine sediment metagenome]
MKKILLIIAIVFCVFQMVILATAIDIGNDVDWSNNISTATWVVKDNPANATGKITSVRIYAGSGAINNVKVATFFVVSGNNLSTRDSEAVASVPAWNTRTYDVDLDVVEGDYIGIYFSAGGSMSGRVSGYAGLWFVEAEKIPCTNQTFSVYADATISLSGTGETVE